MRKLSVNGGRCTTTGVSAGGEGGEASFPLPARLPLNLLEGFVVGGDARSLLLGPMVDAPAFLRDAPERGALPGLVENSLASSGGRIGVTLGGPLGSACAVRAVVGTKGIGVCCGRDVSRVISGGPDNPTSADAALGFTGTPSPPRRGAILTDSLILADSMGACLAVPSP
jgi:hypothetical protein